MSKPAPDRWQVTGRKDRTVTAMPAHITEEPGWTYLDNGAGHGVVPDGQRPRYFSPFITWAAESTGNSVRGTDRQARAALFLIARSYSAEHGFLHSSQFRYRAVPCDAVTGGCPAGNCSRDSLQVRYGKETPALACGYHEKNFTAEVYAGHAIRTEHDNEQAAKTGGRAGYSTWPYKVTS